MGKAREIEITPEMIQAGLKVLDHSGRLWGDWVTLGDDLLIHSILVGMIRHRTLEQPSPQT
jgi:hypothetical protein